MYELGIFRLKHIKYGNSAPDVKTDIRMFSYWVYQIAPVFYPSVLNKLLRWLTQSRRHYDAEKRAF
jgi:hypothetical protein